MRYIVEKAPEVGGLLNRINTITHDAIEMKAAEIIAAKKRQVEADPHITLFTNAAIESVKGYIGNYKVVVKSNGALFDLDISTVIVATGMREIDLKPGAFQYGENPRVVTQIQLEEILKSGKLDGHIKRVVMINCVGKQE